MYPRRGILLDKYFFNRTRQLRDVRTEIGKRSHGFPVTVAFYGEPGAGKTQLVAKLMDTVKLEFDALFFLQAADGTKLLNSIQELGRVLELPSSKGTDPASVKDDMLEWLEQTGKAIQVPHSIKLCLLTGPLRETMASGTR